MKRTLSVLTVMAVLMLALAAPVFAKNTFQTGADQPGGPPSASGSGNGTGAGVDHCNGGTLGEEGGSG